MNDPNKVYYDPGGCGRGHEPCLRYFSTNGCLACSDHVIKAWHEERVGARKAWGKKYEAQPRQMARRFLTGARRAPDCTSSAGEVEAAYATGVHAVTGEVGKIGQGRNELCMGHIHNGPIVGLIWGWENAALSEAVLANWSTFLATAQRHLDIIAEAP